MSKETFKVIPYKLRFEDYFSFNTYFLFQHRSFWHFFWLPIIMTIIFELPYIPDKMDAWEMLKNFSIWLIIWSIGLIFVFPISRKIFKPASDLFEYEIHFEIDNNGVWTSFKGIETKYPWANITDLQRSKNRLFFFVTINCAIIIPERAFENTLALEEFYEFAKENFENAKNNLVQNDAVKQ